MGMGVKISDLPVITIPYSGKETLPIVQSGITKSGNLSTFINYLTGSLLPSPGKSYSWDSAYTTVASTSGKWASVYTTVVNTSSNWSHAYTVTVSNSATWSQGNSSVNAVVQANSGVWDSSNNKLYTQYKIKHSNIQIKGEISQRTLTIYTALILHTVPVGLVVGITVQDDNNKTGILKYIDRANKIIYIKEANYNSNFVIGNYTTNNSNLFTVLSIDSFSSTLQPNHTLKLFNATDNSLSAAELPATSVSVAPINAGNGSTAYEYKIAQFRYSDGKFSVPSTNTPLASCYNVSPALLNESTYNRLLLKRTNTGYGIAVYRKASNKAELGYKLLTILGEDELGGGVSNIPYLDRGGLNTNIWATEIKDTVEGTYNDNVVFYIPTNIDDLALDRYNTGFATARLTSFSARQEATINKSLTGCNEPVDIFIDCSAMYNNSGDLVGGIAKAIDDNSKEDISKIYLPNGRYFTSTLRLFSNCIIEGETQNGCSIKLLPWEFNSQGVINASNISDFYIKNITIDGNHVNNLGRNTVEYNYILNSSNSSKFVFENINVLNSTRGGIYAFRSQDFKIINSNVKNGAIEQTSDTRGTALFAQQANSFILNSNNFENWLGPINLAVSRVGSAANNVIKNCGSGVVVYGSTALQISPNLILGQDGEMLPIADLFDTKFDAINIELESDEQYISDIILYMRDGKGAWLSTLTLSSYPGTQVALSTEIKTLVKTDNFCYTLPFSSFNYSTYSNTPTISIISTEDDLKQGKVQFKLNVAAISSLPTYGQLKIAYDALTGRPSGETLVSLVYKIKATEYLFLDRSEDDIITVSSYEFQSDGKVKLYLENKNDISLFSINDVIYGVNLESASGSTIFSYRDLTIDNIVIQRTGGNITVAYLICSGNYYLEDPPNVILNCINSSSAPSYIGIKNSFTISKGTINKI